MRFLLASLCLLLATGSAVAQHGLGAREQWQPQVGDTDARLQQSVEIEILGRAAVPALELLSEATGVSLSVAPEDLSTVGERKLSIFAHGCTLKDVMVQLCEALQECHWDIDESSDPPVYLLHRNAGVDAAAAREQELEAQLRSPAARAARVAALTRALAMTEEELGSLYESDSQLAHLLQIQQNRVAAESLLALSAEQMQRFLETGEVSAHYGDASEELRAAARERVDHFIFEDDPIQGTAQEQRQRWLDRLPRAVIGFWDGGSEYGYGIWRVTALPSGGTRDEQWDLVLPAKHPAWGDDVHAGWSIGRGGAAKDVAGSWPLIRETIDKHTPFEDEETAPPTPTEPADPDLLQIVALSPWHFQELAEIQRAIASQTGMSVVSDYFTMRRPQMAKEVWTGLPLWRLLDLLGEQVGCRWEKKGKCLVFHQPEWYALAQGEIPESIVLACRDKLESQGALTLADIAAVEAALQDRPIGRDASPGDLLVAGVLPRGSLGRSTFVLYASLSPEQRDKVHSSAGLSFSEMTSDQRRLVLDLGTSALCLVSPEDAQDAVFLVEQADSSDASARYSHGYLVLRFPAESLRTRFFLRKADARPSTPAAAAQ
jgi:hypothetical protein